MRMASAQELRRAQCLEDLILRSVGILIDEGLSVKHGSTQAIPTVHGLLGDERLLDGVRIVHGAQTLDGGNGVAGGVRDAGDAGTNGLAIEKHGTAATLSEAAAELRSVQPEVVAEYVQQRCGGLVYIHRVGTAV